MGVGRAHGASDGVSEVELSALLGKDVNPRLGHDWKDGQSQRRQHLNCGGRISSERRSLRWGLQSGGQDRTDLTGLCVGLISETIPS